eukprot:203485_1
MTRTLFQAFAIVITLLLAMSMTNAQRFVSTIGGGQVSRGVSGVSTTGVSRGFTAGRGISTGTVGVSTGTVGVSRGVSGGVSGVRGVGVGGVRRSGGFVV